jgi:general nucleoside transport system permease protein
MFIRLERRKEPSKAMAWATPVIAVAATMVTGALIFTLIGYNGIDAVARIFFGPLLDSNKWQDLGVKAAPLILIGTGLAIGFRANVWNIGAEGQYVMGGLAGTGMALATWHMQGAWILPMLILAGIAGGAAWAAIPALLKTRLNVNEILSSLMLTYVAVQILYYLMRGPWKDPEGFNFPQTRMFTDSQLLPTVIPETVVHLGIPIAFAVAIAAAVVMARTVFGFNVRVVGAAPAAARYGGFSASRTTWAAMMAGGGLAGLAGVLEAAGPFGQMVPAFPVGYGFTAIIVAFLGRLHPIGIILAAIILAVSYVGGEMAQSSIGLPNAATGVFQAMMLFFLLATDVLARYRIRLGRRMPAKDAP